MIYIYIYYKYQYIFNVIRILSLVLSLTKFGMFSYIIKHDYLILLLHWELFSY